MSDLFKEVTAPNGHKYIQPLGLFINNEFVKSSNNETLDVLNPADESIIASVYTASEDDVDQAVRAARRAFKDPSWSELSPTERGNLMLKLSQLIEQNMQTLATIETWNNGKPYSVSVSEDVPATAAVIKYYAGYADKINGSVLGTGPAKFAYTIREPIGVCGQIIPWNYPLQMAGWKLGPALACGNTVILKAAEQTPLSILCLASLVKEAGFPPGVINIINGHGKVAGAALAKHMGVDKIAFTGSTATGKEIMKYASLNMKNITLETGGKSPLLVFNDAELDQVVKWAHGGVMWNNGQICTATSRILVQEGIYDEFLAAFKARVESMQVGDPFAEGTFQGPQVSKAQYDRILSYIEIGTNEGASVITGGNAVKTVGDGKGFFIAPTVFTGVTSTMRIYREEIFGPVAVVVKFRTEDEALEMANDTEYGLGAAVFTENLTRAHRVARRLEAGMVWINSSQDCNDQVPFGGVKQSGIGSELGESGLAPYSIIKAVHLNMSNRL
ncbi:aldehyde dehydrogenase [Trichoderma sp. SZMC 28013]